MSSQYKVTKINTCTKRTEILRALSPIAQLVVSKLVCRIVDGRADIFMSEKLDIYRCKYHGYKSSIYRANPVVRLPCPQMLIVDENIIKCYTKVNTVEKTRFKT